MEKTAYSKCIVCKCGENRLKFSALDFDTQMQFYEIYQCFDCKFAFTFPYPDKEELNIYYNKSYYGSSEKKFMGFVENVTKLYNYLRAHSIVKICSKTSNGISPGKILDIGCGRGNLLKCMLKYGYECYGLERNDVNLNLNSDIKLMQTDLCNANFDTKYFECVILWHVYEHLENSPEKVIDEITRILANKGVFVFSVPNFTSFQSFIFGKHWFHLDLPRHKYHFSYKSIEILLSKYDYKIIKHTTFSLEQSVFGFTQSVFNKFIPFYSSNKFYLLLKIKKKNAKQYFQLMLFLALSVFIIPFALIEYIISGIFSVGSVITIYAEKFKS
jgi:2-polyprenyl-3-methyl-5-hydroxy-6-metoxy-1,4-benzoquinol methylase